MKILEVTPELIGNTWTLLQETPHVSIWHQLEGRSPEAFARALLASPAVFGFSFGIMRVTDAWAGHMIRVHPMFWSKDVYSKFYELAEGLAELFETGLDRIECVTPVRYSSMHRILDRLGFRFEGRMSKFYKTAHGCQDGILWAVTH